MSDSPERENRAIALATAAVSRMRGLVGWMRPTEPLELQIVGRTLLHAALVGLGAGVLCVLFFVGSEWLAHLLLERFAGYEPLRARGEIEPGKTEALFGLWLLAVIPAVGALVGGLLTRFAPECSGGGGDATVDAFHQHNGEIRRRVLWVKPLASIATLGTGGSGGREGPTMHIGAALGSTVGRYLNVSARERRVLMVAGVAAGISAVFRTPLGAALLAIEMLYRDDFEAEALIPAVLASVIAYSVSITVLGQATMFGYLQPFSFEPQHIPLYIALALVVAAVASLFVATVRGVQRLTQRIPLPAWARPGLGGLALGVLTLAVVVYLAPLIGRGESGVGILGGGYGAAQISITGAEWLPSGWGTVQILLALAAAKIVATSLTIGTGGSAGDFAPSLAIGATLGGACGMTARLLLDDPSIQPGAFALVGMGAFYGGIANTPLAAVILICEMAGSYDLLVPLMLALGVAFIALRRVSLYPAQPRTVRDSPIHQQLDPLQRIRCRDVVKLENRVQLVGPRTAIDELVKIVDGSPDQDVFPVIDQDGVLRGLITAESLRVVASTPELRGVALTGDLMSAPASVTLDQDLRSTAAVMIARDLRSLPVLGDDGSIVALIDEHDIASALVVAPSRPPSLDR